jgi:hypothetical protein
VLKSPHVSAAAGGFTEKSTSEELYNGGYALDAVVIDNHN